MNNRTMKIIGRSGIHITIYLNGGNLMLIEESLTLLKCGPPISIKH